MEKIEDQPATHVLKTWPQFFAAVADGRKAFEIRKNDRDFRVGDVLVVGEFDPDVQQFTGRSVRRIVTYITDFPPALIAGYVVLGLAAEEPIPQQESPTIRALRHRLAYYEARALCSDCMGKVPDGCCPRCHGQAARGA